MGNRHGNDLGHGIQGNIADTESPDEVIDVSDIFLMGFAAMRGFKSHLPS